MSSRTWIALVRAPICEMSYRSQIAGLIYIGSRFISVGGFAALFSSRNSFYPTAQGRH